MDPQAHPATGATSTEQWTICGATWCPRTLQERTQQQQGYNIQQVSVGDTGPRARIVLDCPKRIAHRAGEREGRAPPVRAPAAAAWCARGGFMVPRPRAARERAPDRYAHVRARGGDATRDRPANGGTARGLESFCSQRWSCRGWAGQRGGWRSSCRRGRLDGGRNGTGGGRRGHRRAASVTAFGCGCGARHLRCTSMYDGGRTEERALAPPS